MIAIIDYEMGNLRSVHKAIQRLGGDASIVTDAGDIGKADKIILPGVGAFRDAIANLKSSGLAKPIVDAASRGVPLLGICLGMQLLFDVSYEDGEHRGLGIVEGEVVKFDFDDITGEKLSVPHMGWNSIAWDRQCPLWNGIDQSAYVYFAHSYYVKPANASSAGAMTDYGFPFVSAVWQGNIMGTQFHPEKSQSVGLAILNNFLKL